MNENSRILKRILLSWVTECRFVDQNFFSIEQSDIDKFFHAFRKHHKECKDSNIVTFLRSQYPDFEPNLDDENELSSADYTYVYTLLLHFSCVKCPSPYFHNICQQLSEQIQQGIANLFQQLQQCSTLNRENICHTFATVCQITQLSPPSCDRFASLVSPSTPSTPSIPSSPNSSSVKHGKAARLHLTAQRVSPSTPKTTMLEQRTRELFNLRALLETERYEKGMLEVQLKQNEEKTFQLNQEHKKLALTIQTLRNDILLKNTESNTPSRENDEQIKRRLCKDISVKENEISKLSDLLTNLREDKNLVQEKLMFSEKQMLVCMERIKELEYRVDELSADVEQKTSTIKYLTDNKLELEQFIADTRSSTKNGRPDLNSSAEFLDGTFNRYANSSSSINSPENLASSVVDVKLQEKENENLQLQEQLEAVRINNVNLAKNIIQLVDKYSQALNINIEQLPFNEEEFVDPTEHFMVYANCMDQMSKYYIDEQNKVRKLEDVQTTLEETIRNLNERMQEYEQEVISLKEHIAYVESTNKNFVEGEKKMLRSLEKCEEDMEALSMQKYDLVAKLSDMSEKYDKQKENYEAQLSNMQLQLAASDNSNADLIKSNEELSEKLSYIQREVQTLQTQISSQTSDYELELKTLNDRLASQKEEFQMHESLEEQIREKYEKLIVQHETMKKYKRETDEHLDAMRNEISIKESEMKKLGTEIVDVHHKNTELEARIDQLMSAFNSQKENSGMALTVKEERIQEINIERKQLQHQLEETKTVLDNYIKVVDNIKIVHNVPLDDGNTLASLEQLVTRVKETIDEKNLLSKQLESAESEKMSRIENIQQLEILAQNLKQDKQKLTKKHANDINKSKMELQLSQHKINQHEDKIEQLNAEQICLLRKLESELKEKDVEMTKAVTAKEKIIEELEKQMAEDRTEIVRKEHDLRMAVSQYNTKTKLLTGVERRVTELQQNQENALLQYEQKIKYIKENAKRKNDELVAAIDALKVQNEAAEQRLLENDRVITKIVAEHNKMFSANTEVLKDFEACKQQLSESEEKLKNIKNEYETAINDLKELNAGTTQQLKCVEEQLIAETEEKTQLQKAAQEFSSQLECEQLEKTTILKSLEQTADLLKNAIDEKSKHTNLLEKRCASLQNALTEKSEDMHNIAERQQREREICKKKITDLENNLTEKTNLHESLEKVLNEIISIINDNVDNAIFELEEPSELCDLFEIFKTPEEGSILYQLKNALNKVVYQLFQVRTCNANIEKVRDEYEANIQTITCENVQLTDEIDQHRAEIARLGGMLSDATKSIKDVCASKEEVANLQLLNESLTKEHAEMQNRLDVLLEGYEQLDAVHTATKSELAEIRKQLEEEININNVRLNESESAKLAAQGECGQLRLQLNQVKHEQECVALQNKSYLVDMERIMAEVETLKAEKLQLLDEIKHGKHEIQRTNDNISQLITQIRSIQVEREELMAANKTLHKQMEEFTKEQTSSEVKLKSIKQRSQSLERKLTNYQSETLSLKTHLENSDSNTLKLTSENKKLRDSLESTTKRLEKVSVKLGECQARCSKLERENEQLLLDIKSHTNAVETFQRDKTAMLERVISTERYQDQLLKKIQELEKVNNDLNLKHQNQELHECERKNNISKLEKMRAANEDKIRKLTSSLNSSEQENRRLNLEVGAINSELAVLQKTNSRNEETVKCLTNVKMELNKSEEQCGLLNKEIEALRTENVAVIAQLSNLTQMLEATEEQCNTYAAEIVQLKEHLSEVSEEMENAKLMQLDTKIKLKESDDMKCRLEFERQELLNEHSLKVSELEAALKVKTTLQDKLDKNVAEFAELQTKFNAQIVEMGELRKELDNKNTGIAKFENEIDIMTLELKKKFVEETFVVHEESKGLRERVRTVELMLAQEQEVTKQLDTDNKILQAKYADAKERLREAAIAADERIKENRLELEGKLEKMKNKMKNLFTEETKKMKTKQERETANFKSEMEVLRSQNLKYEQHTQKLSKQIMLLNDKLLELQKQNAIATTKLKHLDDNGGQHFKRPGTANVAPKAVAAHANLGSNLTMEDEEGEVFNNTYLTDLKGGFMSEIMNRDICVDELRYRNSLLLPHLKSSYAAQYDHGVTEDEMKDGGPHSLDDSMSALLSTTTGAMRKKISGVTNYKRPGPPTPSKNSGRLSFGGMSEPTREILKETFIDAGNNATASAKTPTRFNFFASRFSMGNAAVKDEHFLHDLRRTVQVKNMERVHQLNAGEMCTSTPRKSRCHLDNRRILLAIMSPLSTPPLTCDISSIAPATPTTPKTPPYKLLQRRRCSGLLKRSIVHRRSDVTSSSSCERFSGGAAALGVSQQNPKRQHRIARSSFYLNGNIFARYRSSVRNRCTAIRGRGSIRDRARTQRDKIFNQFRRLSALKSDEADSSDAEIAAKIGKTMIMCKAEIPFEEEQHALVLSLATQDNSDGFGFLVKNEDDEDNTSAIVVDWSLNPDTLDYRFSFSNMAGIRPFDELSNSTHALQLNDNDNICDDTVELMNDDEIVTDTRHKNDNNNNIAKQENNISNGSFTDMDEDMKKQLVATQAIHKFEQNIQWERDSIALGGDSKLFEKLLDQTESHAPFVVKKLQYDDKQLVASSSLTTLAPNPNLCVISTDLHGGSSSYSDTATTSKGSIRDVPCSTVIQSNTQNTTISSISNANFSRTIYGPSVIYNRRLPRIRTTLARKSSIYIKKLKKKENDNDDDGIMLVTNQTITLLDLMRMWQQMSAITRVTFAFAGIAAVTAFIFLLIIAFFYVS